MRSNESQVGPHITHATSSPLKSSCISNRNGTKKGASHLSQHLFESHFRMHFEKPWVRVLFYENEVWHAELLYQASHFEQALDVVRRCLPIIEELSEQDAFRTIAPSSRFRLLSVQDMSYKSLNLESDAQMAFEQLQQTAVDASRHPQSATNCLSYAEIYRLPESIFELLKE